MVKSSSSISLIYNLIIFLNLMKPNTKLIEIPCSLHRQFDREIGYFNACKKDWNCHWKLVCADCEADIEVNEKAEQYCPKCEQQEILAKKYEPK